MEINDIKRGIELAFFREDNQRAVGSAFAAEFRHAESEHLFIVNSLSLYNSFDSLAPVTRFIVAFEMGPMLYTFGGRLKDKMRSPNLVTVEQTGFIKEFNRRKRDRDELLFRVDIFDIPPEFLKSGAFESLDADPILSDSTYDISTSGMCIVSNSLLKSKYNEPYFLVKLVVSDKDIFVLPAKLVRKIDFRRTGLGNHEYGFQFIFDNLPDMEKHLTEAIMRRKLG